MTDPLKLQILKALVNGLKTITPAGGYQNDMSDFDPGDGGFTPRVYRGRAFFGDGDPVPMLSVLEAAIEDDVTAEQTSQKPSSKYWWPIVIQGWIKDDPVNCTDPAYPLLADVRLFLAGEMKRGAAQGNRNILGFSDSVVSDIRFGGGRVRPANDASAYAGFHLLLELEIMDKADKPYG